MELTAERWQQVRDLFEEALRLPPDERERFIAAACGNDQELRGELESLLAHDANAVQDPLRPPTLIVEAKRGVETRDTAPAADALIGRRVGQYLVRAVIASGGMGTVYEAEQERPRRVVALKVMSRGLGSPAAVRRFQAEAEFLAHLRHPNIAHVYEAGMHGEGPRAAPYFAMELVQGARTITRYADEEHLDARARLALFAKVCDAVHHGHQKSVIHRDLKPGNILVGDDTFSRAARSGNGPPAHIKPAADDPSARPNLNPEPRTLNPNPEPKVIDFGVARATDVDLAVTQQTAVGDLVGTMQYMSPEQCDADPLELDFRSDVYSLGVMLYELLTGTKPYDATTTIFHATQVIKTHAPRPPSQIVRKLRGDIETIVLKALEKDREKRYQSAADLRDDLRRHLNREPINARPPTRWTRAVRWAARHPVWTTAATCLLVAVLSLSLATAATWWLGMRPNRVFVNGDRSEVQLLSPAGVVLQRWSTPPGSRGIRLVSEKLIKKTVNGERRRYLPIAFAHTDESRDVGELSVYSVDKTYRDPLWTATLDRSDLPDEPSSGQPFPNSPEFSVTSGLVAHVFADDGPELVAAHQLRGRTHTVLRIYTLEGQILWQVAIDCLIESMVWLPEPGLLVISGIDGQYLWVERGVEGGSIHNHPSVLFALRPQRGYRTSEYVAQEPGERAGAPVELRPVWYKCMRVKGDNFRAIAELDIYSDKFSVDSNREFRLRLKDDRPADREVCWSVEWRVRGANGEILEGPAPSDVYLRQLKIAGDNRPPPPEDWYFGVLPPAINHPASRPSP